MTIMKSIVFATSLLFSAFATAAPISISCPHSEGVENFTLNENDSTVSWSHEGGSWKENAIFTDAHIRFQMGEFLTRSIDRSTLKMTTLIGGEVSGKPRQCKIIKQKRAV